MTTTQRYQFNQLRKAARTLYREALKNGAAKNTVMVWQYHDYIVIHYTPQHPLSPYVVA